MVKLRGGLELNAGSGQAASLFLGAFGAAADQAMFELLPRRRREKNKLSVGPVGADLARRLRACVAFSRACALCSGVRSGSAILIISSVGIFGK